MKNKKTTHRIILSVTLVILSVCVGFTVLNLTVRDVREKTASVLSDISGGRIMAARSEDSDIKKLGFYRGVYVPLNIPAEYILTDIGVSGLTYINDKNFIIYKEYPLGTSIGVNEDNAIVKETVTIDGYEGYYIEDAYGKILLLTCGNTIIDFSTNDFSLDIKEMASVLVEDIKK